MMKFDIESVSFLGLSHHGAVATVGEGVVELEEDEVCQLVEMIREKKTTDVGALGIERSHPELYEKLREAYHDTAYRAVELHWLWEGYRNDCFAYDDDELKRYCKEHCGFAFEYDEEDYYDEDGELDERMIEYDENDLFETWLYCYLESLDDEETRAFFYNHMDAELYLDDIDYEVLIPEGIIKMAKEG